MKTTLKMKKTQIFNSLMCNSIQNDLLDLELNKCLMFEKIYVAARDIHNSFAIFVLHFCDYLLLQYSVNKWLHGFLISLPIVF